MHQRNTLQFEVIYNHKEKSWKKIIQENVPNSRVGVAISMPNGTGFKGKLWKEIGGASTYSKGGKPSKLIF